MAFSEVLEVLLGFGGTMVIICLPIGGLMWATAKSKENMNESHRKDKAQFYKHHEDTFKTIFSKRRSLRKEQIPDLSDEELMDVAKAAQEECMRRWRRNESAMGAVE